MTEPIYLIETQTGKRYTCFTDQELKETTRWLYRKNIDFYKRTEKETKTMFNDRDQEPDISKYLTTDLFELSSKTVANERLTATQTDELSRLIKFLAMILQQAEESIVLQDCARYIASIQSKSFRHNSNMLS